MKALAARVRTHLGTYHPHHLEILVDQVTRGTDTKTYDVKNYPDGTAAYFSVEGGEASFFFHNPKNETGFGGTEFTLPLKDGSQAVIKGPWSSSEAFMAQEFGIETVSVSYTDKPESFEKGYTFFGGSITLDLAKEAVALAGNDWELLRGDHLKPAGREDASGAQNAIIDGGMGDRGWYVVRKNCPTARVIGLKPWRDTMQRYPTDELEPDYCMYSWHMYEPDKWIK